MKYKGFTILTGGVLLLLLALAPAALAATAGDFTIELLGGGDPQEGFDYEYESQALTILSNVPMRVSGTTSRDRMIIQKGTSANITLAGAQIDLSEAGGTAFTIEDNGAGGVVTLTVQSGTSNAFISGADSAGLQKNGGTLIIACEPGAAGTLVAQGGENAPGISGGAVAASGNFIAPGVGSAAQVKAGADSWSAASIFAAALTEEREVSGRADPYWEIAFAPDAPSSHMVRFVDWDGRLIKEERVAQGQSATPPADPRRAGYLFDGWNGNYEFVQADATATAMYEKDISDVLTLCVEDQPFDTLEVGIGKSKTITAYDAKGNHVEATWKTDDKDIAAIKDKTKGRGKVTGVKTGTVTITATAKDGRSGTMEIEVLKASQVITSGELNKQDKTLKVGDTYKLKATLKPKGAKNKELYWMSMNEDIATVDQNGEVEAVGPGRVTIKAWTPTGIKLWCKFTVK